MNRQVEHGCPSRINRTMFYRALKLEGLENRRLLAADFQAAVDTSANVSTGSELPVAAEVSQSADLNVNGSLNGQLVDDGLLDELAAAVAEGEGTSDQQPFQLASFQLNLFNGQSFGLSLNQSAPGSFQLQFNNQATPSVPMTNASTIDFSGLRNTLSNFRDSLSNSLSTLSPGLNLGSRLGSLGSSLGSTLGSTLGNRGWGSLMVDAGTSGSAGGDTSLGSSWDLSGLTSNNIAAPMVGSLGSGMSNLFGSSLNTSLWGSTGLSGSTGVSGGWSNGLTFGSGSSLGSNGGFSLNGFSDPTSSFLPQSSVNVGASGSGSALGNSVGANNSVGGGLSSGAASGTTSTGMNLSGLGSTTTNTSWSLPSWRSGYLPAGTHMPDNPTVEELAWQWRA